MRLGPQIAQFVFTRLIMAFARVFFKMNMENRIFYSSEATEIPREAVVEGEAAALGCGRTLCEQTSHASCPRRNRRPAGDLRCALACLGRRTDMLCWIK